MQVNAKRKVAKLTRRIQKKLQNGIGKSKSIKAYRITEVITKISSLGRMMLKRCAENNFIYQNEIKDQGLINIS